MIVVTLIYLWVAFNELRRGNNSDAWIMAAYAAANLGFIARFLK